MQTWIAWLIAAIVLFVVEMTTPGAFYFACLGLGALTASLAAYLQAPLWVSWLAFFGCSVLFVLIARPIAKKMMDGESRPSNIDELVGQEALVIERIVPYKGGQIKVKGEIWRAESTQEIPVDSLVEIIKVEGARLIVKVK